MAKLRDDIEGCPSCKIFQLYGKCPKFDNDLTKDGKEVNTTNKFVTCHLDKKKKSSYYHTY